MDNISFTRDTTTEVNTNKNGYTEAQQRDYMVRTATDLVKENRRVQEEELYTDSNFIDSMRILHAKEQGMDTPTPPDQELVKWGLGYLADVNYNLVDLGKAAYDFNDASDMEKMAMSYGLDTYDAKDITMDGVQRFAEAFATDPTNLIGFGTLGAGFAAKMAGKTVAKQAFKKMLMNPANIAAMEGAAFLGAEDTMRQNLDVDIGKQDEYSATQGLTSVAVGAVAGKALGEAAGYVGKKYGEYRASQPDMPMRTGGLEIGTGKQQLDLKTVQEYIGSKGETHAEASSKLDQQLQSVQGDYEGKAYRGMTDQEGTLSKLNVGDTYTTRGVTSIAKDMDTAQTFANRNWEDTEGKKIFVTFDSFTNKPVNLGQGNKLGLEDPLDTTKTGPAYLEDEVVIPSGRSFEVVSKTEKDGAIYFNVKEVETGKPLRKDGESIIKYVERKKKFYEENPELKPKETNKLEEIKKPSKKTITNKFNRLKEFDNFSQGMKSTVVDIPYKLPKEKVYRGESENSGYGLAMFGSGLYSTTSIGQAKKYGKIRNVEISELPINPIQFKAELDFSQFEYELAKELGIDKRDIFENLGNIDEYLTKMGYDGIAVGKGNSRMFVTFPDSESNK